MSTPFDTKPDGSYLTADEMRQMMQNDPAKFRELDKATEVPITDPKAPRVFRNGRLISGAPPSQD